MLEILHLFGQDRAVGDLKCCSMGQVCDQTAPRSGRSFVVNSEHRPPFPSEVLQQLKHKKIRVCKTTYIAKTVMPNTVQQSLL